jgi:hypothetical protein
MSGFDINPITGEIIQTGTTCNKTYKNTIQVTKVTVNDSTGTKINLPEDAQNYRLYYCSTETLWLGGTSGVTAEGNTSFPVISMEYFYINLASGNTNELYGISSSGNIDVYVYAEIEA